VEVVEERRRLRERIVREASEWVSSLRFRLTAFLVGSFARGDFNLWSDIDILLVSDDLGGGPLERLKSIDFPPGYQVIPVTREEFERLARRKDPLAEDAVKTGVVLRDDLNIAPTK